MPNEGNAKSGDRKPHQGPESRPGGQRGAIGATPDTSAAPMTSGDHFETPVTRFLEKAAAAGASDEFVSLLYDSAPIGYAVLNAEGRVLQVNRAGAVLLDDSEATLVGRPLSDFVDTADRKRFLTELHRVCGGMATADADTPPRELHARLDVHRAVDPGATTAVEPHRLRLFLGSYSRDLERLCFTTIVDITAQSVAQAQLEENGQGADQSTLDALSAQIAVLDARGRITRVNAAWRRFGRENRAPPGVVEGIGMDYLLACREHLGEEATPYAAQAQVGIQRVIDGEQAEFTLEYPCHAPQKKRWFLMSVTPLGQVGAGAVVAHLDISERVQGEYAERLRQEEIAHAARINSVAVLAVSLVHELSQPLSAASLFAESGVALVRQEPVNQGQVLGVLSDLQEQVDRAVGIVRALRRFMHRGNLQTEPCELEVRIRSALELVDPMACRKGIRVVLEPPPASVVVRVNPLQIEQVLVNLLCNSIESIDRSGAEQRQIRIRIDTSKHEARVQVADTGAGVSPEWAARIFDIFESEKETGMGIGLAVSRTIIEAHGGKLWVESGANEGGVLRFTLPLWRQEITT